MMADRFTPVITAPEAPAPTDYGSAFVLSGRVVPSDIDILGHVNNAVYVTWVQDAAVAHWNHLATPAMAKAHVWVCIRHEIDYRAPLFDGEAIEMRTWLGARTGARFDRHVDIRKAGSPKWSAQAKTTWAMLHRDTGRPARIGAEITEMFGIR